MSAKRTLSPILGDPGTSKMSNSGLLFENFLDKSSVWTKHIDIYHFFIKYKIEESLSTTFFHFSKQSDTESWLFI